MSSLSVGEKQSEAPEADLAELSDHVLVRRFQQGSQDAATQIYRRYAERLRALAKSKCSPDLAVRADADDIVQCAFRSFFQAVKRGAYEVAPKEQLWHVLAVIALNRIRSEWAFHRAAKRDVRATAGIASFKHVAQTYRPHNSPSACSRLVLADALQSLPPLHRQLIDLRMQGYEVAQIAEQTGRSKRTVERLLQEAREKLQAIFHDPE
jgi:RNA polymerase sigma-70 factor (ECF subfamily)